MLVVGGSLAYRFFFHRPGESAIHLIPADAFLVVTLDTHPSPAQVPIFERIHKALEQQGLSKKIESVISDTVQKSPVVAQVRPYTSTSFAFAMLSQGQGKSGFDGEPVVLISATDTGKIEETLKKNGKQESHEGVSVYKFAADKTFAAVIGNYLVVAQKPADIARIDAVRKGDVKAVSSLTEYQEARSGLPEDANLMVFLSPTAMKQISDEAKKNGGPDLQKTSQWMAFSATLRDAGVAFDYRMPADPSSNPGLKSAAEIAALDFSMMGKLPSGAYGLMALSQPDHYWDSTTGMVRQDPKMAKQMDEGIAEFEKQTGMNVQKDILPGLKGHLWMAAYPDARGADRGVDGLIVIDDSNGADPAALADKVRILVQKTSSENGKQGVTFHSQEKNGATVWSLDERSTAELRKGMEGAASAGPQMFGGSPAGHPTVSISPNFGDTQGADTHININTKGSQVHVNAPESTITIDGTNVDVRAPGAKVDVGRGGANADPTSARVQLDDHGIKVDGQGVRVNGKDVSSAHAGAYSPYADIQKPEASPEARRFAENKTVVYAQVGKAILIATSQEMLDKAISAYHGQGPTLASDTPYSNMRNALPSGSQSAMMVNLGAIMQALKPTVEKAMKGNEMGLTADDIVNLFGQSAGVVAGGKYDGKTMVGAFFLPIDYERGIKGIGALMRSFDHSGPDPSKMSWLRHAPEAAGALSGAPGLYAVR
jgi:hypothetical protein